MMMPPPTPVPSVNRTMLCTSLPAPAQNSPKAAALASFWKAVGRLKRVLHVIADRHVAPRLEVGRIEDDAGGNVHGARRGHADGGDVAHLEPGGGHGLADGLAHAFQAEFLAAMRLRSAD